MLPIYNTGNNPSTTVNQAALGNQMGSYGQAGNYGLQGGLGTYLGNSIGGYLQNGIFNGNWKDVAGAFGDKGATYAGGSGSITGYDSGLGAVAGFAGGLLDRSAAHQRTSGKYGHVAQSADTIANVVGSVGNYNPLATGLGRLGMGTINKITGGTDGMTVQDSLLGSGAIQGTLTGIAAASGPIGWGVAGAYALSSGYTDMDLENEAQQLYNKKYGGFSRGAYKKAQKKINQAQMRMTDKMNIRDTAELGQIRAGMVDANNMRYQMSINGGYKPLAIGRDGLKITPERLKEAKEIAKCIRQKKRNVAFTNVIPAEAREAMRDVTKVPNDAVPFFQEGGQMNVIPEGSLHARLHHMEDSEHITKKGIPVVDLNGKQQAEIERNEIIFRKEVTSKLEELAKDGSDEAAIEAGKLLATEIIENTDDRTGLIEEVTGTSEEIPLAEKGMALDPKVLAQGLQAGLSVFSKETAKKKEEKGVTDLINQLDSLANSQASRDFEGKNNMGGRTTVDDNGIVSGNEKRKEVQQVSSRLDQSMKIQQLKQSLLNQDETKKDNPFLQSLMKALTKDDNPVKKEEPLAPGKPANVLDGIDKPNIPEKIQVPQIAKDGDKLPENMIVLGGKRV